MHACFFSVFAGSYDLNLILGSLSRILNKRGALKINRPDRLNCQARNAEGQPAGEHYVANEVVDDPGYLTCIKRVNRFITLQTPDLKFLDISQYLAPGTSLRKFIQCFKRDSDGDLGKLYFPYELVQCSKDLDRPDMPPYDAFYSSLKQANSLEDGLTGAEALERGRQNYEMMCDLWSSEQCSSLRSLLKIYNTQDVLPFHRAVKRLIDMYDQLEIDMFSYMTLPGKLSHKK